ncbi:MAG: sulfotransferase domain-containing protein [Actinomycetota bacterium]
MAGNTGKPERTRVYDNHHLDSTRWDTYVRRPGDVIISTSVKAGTTWTQRIFSLFVFGTDPLPTGLWQVSPWIDNRIFPLEPILAEIEAQEHKRFLKSHLPLDALPYHEDVHYIVVGRDARDVAMSLFNHYSSYTDLVHGMMESLGVEGEPFPRAPSDVREFWRDYMTRSWHSHSWESDGYPYWSHHYHAESFWKHRALPNIHFVHYNDLKTDLEGEMRQLAEVTGFEVDDAAWPSLVHAATFDVMKEDARVMIPEIAMIFGSVDNFMFKGTNERWRDALTSSDLELYEAQACNLDPELRAWLESGRLASGIMP